MAWKPRTPQRQGKHEQETGRTKVAREGGVGLEGQEIRPLLLLLVLLVMVLLLLLRWVVVMVLVVVIAMGVPQLLPRSEGRLEVAPRAARCQRRKKNREKPAGAVPSPRAERTTPLR